MKAELVVIGSGPGGYSAAFRAADLGKQVILIERYSNLGGVCLNVGCIPSKALLHAAKVIEEAHDMANCGVTFSKPTIDLEKLVAWKNKVISQLTGGLKALAKQRKVELVEGVVQFKGPNQLSVMQDGKETLIDFDHCVIAAGSQPVKLPFLPEDPRILDSTTALDLQFAQPGKRMLVIGGGIIGLEMATVYDALGVKVSVVEFADQLIPVGDKDLVQVLHKRIEKRYEHIWLKTKVTKVEAKKDGLHVSFEGENAPTKTEVFDIILSAVGRTPNGKLLAAEKAGVKVDDRGFIPVVDKQLRTNVPHIFAIGDINGNPMLAHKAVPEGRLVAEVVAGKKHFFDPKCIPSVAYTDPEIAWTGLTEKEAKEKNIVVGVGKFPWAASGRAISNNRTEGFTKVLFDEQNRIIGGGIVGPNAGELISEISLAIEMGCDAEDLSLTIHPHPTLSESVMMAVEMFEGTATDLISPNKDKDKK